MEEEISRIELKDELDLHHFNPRDAKGLIGDFIENAKSLGLERLRIVHGRGRSVMKSIVLEELKKNTDVISFQDDSTNWGATIVLIRSGK
jgi:DNA-nicking Smr family endonuclease